MQMMSAILSIVSTIGSAWRTTSIAGKKASNANHFEGVVEDSIFQGESQLMVIKLDPKTYGAQSLRMRLPNSSVDQKALPGIGETVTLGLKIADSYFVEASHGGA